jgi:hypothetical protein
MYKSMVIATMMMSEFLIRWDGDGGIQGYPLASGYPTHRDRRPQVPSAAGLLRSCQTPVPTRCQQVLSPLLNLSAESINQSVVANSTFS